MANIDRHTSTAGAYVLYDGYFAFMKENDGKFILARPLPEDAILVPHAQLCFLDTLFALESEMMADFMKAR